jgi:aspartate-semialdehyde dehydrogenase
MSEKFDIAVVGCTSLVGEAILESLAQRQFPLGRLHAVDSKDAAGQKLEFRERYLTVESLDSFDFGKVRLAIFATSSKMTASHAARAAAAGCTVVDASGHFRERADVPLVVSEVNPEQLRGLVAGAVVASPSPAATLLALVLKPLQQRTGLERVHATVLYPASTAGRAGVEELASQTAQLLNARAIKPRVFDRQLAFNLLPLVGQPMEGGDSSEEASLARQLRRLVDEHLAIDLTIIQVPVFYGLAATVTVATADPLAAADAQELLARAPWLRVMEPAAADGYPTPVTEAARHDELFVGRLRGHGSQPRGLNFWTVADNVRKGAATNSIQLAEMLLRGGS